CSTTAISFESSIYENDRQLEKHLQKHQEVAASNMLQLPREGRVDLDHDTESACSGAVVSASDRCEVREPAGDIVLIVLLVVVGDVVAAESVRDVASGVHSPTRCLVTKAGATLLYYI
ncbi:Os08g0385650, partial [Oryza sativa Japonica Group]